MDRFQVGRQVVERLAALARDSGRRHVEITGEVERHGAVQDAAHGGAVDVGRPDPPEHLMHGVGISEDVVRSLPVTMLVGIPEARDPQRRRVGERSSEVDGSGAGADRRYERVDDLRRLIGEQLLGERRVVRPALRAGAGGEQLRQLPRRFIAERNEIDGLAPRCRFFGATGGDHLADNRRQHRRCVLPSDEVEALERLVDEVERMAGIGIGPRGRGREQCVCKGGRQKTGGNSREQGAFARFAMAHVRPPPQPALERDCIWPASQRRPFSPRRFPVAGHSVQLGAFTGTSMSLSKPSPLVPSPRPTCRRTRSQV